MTDKKTKSMAPTESALDVEDYEKDKTMFRMH